MNGARVAAPSSCRIARACETYKHAQLGVSKDRISADLASKHISENGDKKFAAFDTRYVPEPLVANVTRDWLHCTIRSRPDTR